MNAAAMECRSLAGGDAERHYLESLNVCFPAWGGREMFDWCFSRESAGLRPDLMVLHDAGRAVAGTANTYRRIRLPNGQAMAVGIMTGSWTLPEARGRGAFTRLIGESIERASARRAGLLLGFFARTNPSAGRLAAAGSALFPSWYIRSPERRTPDERPAAPERPAMTDDDDGTETRRGWVDDVGALNVRGSGGVIAEGIEDRQDLTEAVRFVYTEDEWRDQFVRRPNPVARVRSADTARPPRWRALVERTESFDRVLSLAFSDASAADVPAAGWVDAIAALDARAAGAGRRVFCYTTDPDRAAALRRRGFEIVDGCISALAANGAILRAAFSDGHRADLPDAPSSSSSHVLADPASPWHLGRWFVRNGDRM